MLVRRFTAADLLEGEKVMAVAFHRDMDVEARASAIAASNPPCDHVWGCFTDAGDMAACIVNNQYNVYYDGRVVKMGGIGGVSCLPEYRESGCVKSIFAYLLRAARDEGEVFSSLYPFSHIFYRKFGYEMCDPCAYYELGPRAFTKFRDPRFTARRAHVEDGELPPIGVYERFAARYNMAVARDERVMKRNVEGGHAYNGCRYTYVARVDGEDRAYATYHFVNRGDAGALLEVNDLAFDGVEGFRSLLAFFSRMSADYRAVRLPLPKDVPLLALIDEPYDAQTKLGPCFMARTTNPREALRLMRRDGGLSFTIKVTDDFIAENGGVFRVDGSGVELTGEATPDIEVSVQALALLCLGYASLGELKYRSDIVVNSNEAALERAFIAKPMYIADHF